MLAQTCTTVDIDRGFAQRLRINLFPPQSPRTQALKIDQKPLSAKNQALRGPGICAGELWSHAISGAHQPRSGPCPVLPKPGHQGVVRHPSTEFCSSRLIWSCSWQMTDAEDGSSTESISSLSPQRRLRWRCGDARSLQPQDHKALAAFARDLPCRSMLKSGTYRSNERRCQTTWALHDMFAVLLGPRAMDFIPAKQANSAISLWWLSAHFTLQLHTSCLRFFCN